MVRLAVAVVVVALAAAVAAFTLPTETELKAEFVKFVHKYEKTTYGGEEMNKRFQIFKDNYIRIQLYNKLYNTDVMEINRFADLTPQEFRSYYLMKKKTAAQMRGELPFEPAQQYNVSAAPISIDWRTLGAVTPVKNQASCGSCWAFSATGNIEGQWFKSTKKLVSLSEQQLVDCDKECVTWQGQKSCDDGCNGGLMWAAYNYAIKSGGLESETTYRYQGYDGTCRFKKQNVVATIKSWKFLPTNEDQLAAAVAQDGPVAVAINADLLQFYGKGIIKTDASQCDPDALDHGVLIVGYGVEGNTPYWIVKNSWATSWGEKGYFRIQRGTNACGIASVPSSAYVN
jgi:cathepsin F